VATTAAAAAQAAQASAETAETNAETAETNAAASASSASSSASSASTSADEAAASAASINPDNIDINGGTVDGTVIGGSVPAAGSFTTGSFTGDVAHGDGVKATFGASSDLRIYHNGSNSYIDDTGVGSLFIRSNELRINKYTGEFMLRAAADGPVELYYDNSKKLETTSSGINVSGTAVADGLTVDGDIRINTTSGKLTYVNDTAGWTVDMEDGTSDLYIRSGVASPTDRLKIDGSGDLSLYDSTGTTPKFFWDASNESLGIGMSSPSITFAVDSTKPFRISASVPNITFVETDASNQNWSTGSYGGTFAVRDITGSGYPLQIEAGTANNTLYLDSNNRVGIGTSSPNSLLYLYGAPEATSGAVATIRDSSATSSNTSFGSLVFSSSPGTDYAIGKSNVNAASTLSFRNANTGSSYVDIDSAGNLEMTGGGSVGWANFTFKEESGYLYVYNGPTKIM